MGRWDKKIQDSVLRNLSHKSILKWADILEFYPKAVCQCFPWAGDSDSALFIWEIWSTLGEDNHCIRLARGFNLNLAIHKVILPSKVVAIPES